MTAQKLIKLTKRSVDALKPGATRFDVFDAHTRGFAVRVHPCGRRTYRFKYLSGGRQRVVTIGEHGAPWTAEAARVEAQILRGQVASGLDPALAIAERKSATLRVTSNAVSVGDLIERWLTEGRAAAPNKRESSWRHDASRLRRHIAPLLGDRDLATLRRADIERAQYDIAEGATAVDEKTGVRGRAIVRGGRAAARSAITTLSAALAWAVDQGLISTNPAAKLKKIAAHKCERFLSKPEAARLLDTLADMQAAGAVASVFADAFRLLLLTGARKSEIARLTWDEVDLPRNVIRLGPARAKNGAKVIMLNSPAAALIAARPHTGPFVFASTIDGARPIVGLQKAWARVRARAELPDVRLHDLRHSFASFAAESGASMPMIAKALGHTQTSTSERYAHLGEDPVRNIAERVGASIVSVERNNAN